MMKKEKFNKRLFNEFKKIFFPFYKSKEINKIFNILEKDEPNNLITAMFVGGCVRKFILNEKIDDIDIATIFTPEEIKKKFIGTDVKVIETGIKHGTITLMLNDKKFELTTLRKDLKTDGRHADVLFTENWFEDSKRRDFTINAIYLDRKGNFFDPQHGIEDLENKIVKFIGDPHKRIQEDYLRIIRFVRFSIIYSKNILEKSSIDGIKLNLNGIKNLSKERIFSELIKIFKLKNFENILEHNELKTIFLMIFPEFKYLERLKEIKLVNSLELKKNNIYLILSILLIDETNNHEYFCHKYKVSNEIRDKLNMISVILYKYKINKDFIRKDLKKNIYFLGKNNIKNFIFFLFFANQKMSEREFLKIYKDIDNVQIPDFPFNGYYLKEKGISEGKKIGLILKKLENEWLNNNYELSEKNALDIIEKNNNQTY